jgi:hypothetical protein
VKTRAKCAYGLGLVLLIALGHGDASAQPRPAWQEPGWQGCLAKYKSAFNDRTRPPVYRFVNGRCGELDSEIPKLPAGRCFMAFSGPADILQSRGYEVLLQCKTGYSAETRCTNRSDFYNEQHKNEVRARPECAGFPDLLAKNLRGGFVPAPLGSGNNARCRQLVRGINQMETNPAFDSDATIRRRWSERVDEATKMGCEF